MTDPDPAQLPFLIALFDDESELVRDPVLAKLAEFGDTLDAELASLPEPPAADRLAALWIALQAHSSRTARAPGESRPRFQPGDFVRHVRYGYRGLVVERDESCSADDGWYQRNQTQPDRNQPWYHVLVDGTDAATYAAQTSLVADDSCAKIQHALIPHFFTVFDGPRYVRNELPWPRVDR